MKTVIIDINCSTSTVYYVGSQGDDKVTTLHFNGLEEGGSDYAITLQNSEKTFKKIPLVNNEMVLSGGYTTQGGLLNAQVFVKKNEDWIAYSKVLKLMLLNSIQESPQPEPSETTPYVVFKEYNENGYDITGNGPCVVQNEKTDVRIKFGTNEYTEIDCLGGQYTLIKKVEASTNGVIGYFTNDDGVTEYIELQDGVILNGPADGDNHWGLLSVSKDNKTLTKLEFVNGLKTDVQPTDDGDVANKKYVDDVLLQKTNSLNRVIGVWKEGIINSYNNGLVRQSGYGGLLYEVDLSKFVGKKIYFNCTPLKTDETNNVGINTNSSSIFLYDFKNTCMFYDEAFNGSNGKKATSYPLGNYPHYLTENNNIPICGVLNVTENSKYYGYNVQIENVNNAKSHGWLGEEGHVNPEGVDVIFTVMEVN